MFTKLGRRAVQAVSVLLVALLTLMAAPTSIAGAQEARQGQAAQETQEDTSKPGTIADIAVATPELSTLVTALTVATEAGAVDFLGTVSDPEADLTVFAPTNDAFDALGDTLGAALADPGGLLTDVLLYHVLGTSETGAELLAAETATTLLGQDVTITTDVYGDVFINDSKVVIADIPASNGIVHVIDAVLLPPAPEPGTIADIAVATPELSTLVAALDAAGLVGAVADPAADLTVFAPTNDAFAALGQETINALLADPTGLLTDILLYHVATPGQDGATLAANGSATTLQGDDVVVTVQDGDVFINDSKVVIADIPASNGIVHVIDAVLLPPAEPEPSPIFDGARVYLVNAESDRYLDADRGWWGSNVDTSSTPRFDDEWILQDAGNGNWRLFNPGRYGFLDADGKRRHYNVDLAWWWARGTVWEIEQLDNGNYAVRNVRFNRFLDWDRRNVDTTSNFELDNEWMIELVPGH